MASKFFPAWKEIMCNTGMPIICKIGGFDPNTQELMWMEEIFLPSMPRGHTLDEVAAEACMIITGHIWLVYRTHDVPDDVVWQGKVIGSISGN